MVGSQVTALLSPRPVAAVPEPPGILPSLPDPPLRSAYSNCACMD
jgi:hypothetical protein